MLMLLMNSLFFITSISIVRRISLRCFQNHIGCEMVFTTISLSFLLNYVCQPHVVFWRTKIQRFFHGHSKRRYGCLYWLSQSGTTTGALVLSRVLFASVWLIILKGWICNNKCCSISRRMHQLLVLLLWDTM